MNSISFSVNPFGPARFSVPALYASSPKYLEDLCFDSVEAVRYELAVNYGIEENRVLQALKELETETCVTV